MFSEVLVLAYMLYVLFISCGLSSRNESSEGAVGFTPDPFLSSADSEEDVSALTKEQEEIRRRRIQKFGQSQGSG